MALAGDVIGDVIGSVIRDVIGPPMRGRGLPYARRATRARAHAREYHTHPRTVNTSPSVAGAEA